LVLGSWTGGDFDTIEGDAERSEMERDQVLVDLRSMQWTRCPMRKTTRQEYLSACLCAESWSGLALISMIAEVFKSSGINMDAIVKVGDPKNSGVCANGSGYLPKVRPGGLELAGVGCEFAR
jgi:hypothetical protein